MAINFKNGPYQEPTTAAMPNKLPITARVAHLGRQALRGVARGLAVLIALIASLALIGATYEALSASGDARTYPPPGRLVDVGGYRLHIHCLGTGSPTVVLDAGLSGMSHDWNLVQAEIAQTTRVCAYDRAGMGWSDAGPLPRTPEQIARELHTLLTNAGIASPYMLVGHSLGGKNVRMFALQHPEQVAGMVLVDARSEFVDDAHLGGRGASFPKGDAGPVELQRGDASLRAGSPPRRERGRAAHHGESDTDGDGAVHHRAAWS